MDDVGLIRELYLGTFARGTHVADEYRMANASTEDQQTASNFFARLQQINRSDAGSRASAGNDAVGNGDVPDPAVASSGLNRATSLKVAGPYGGGNGHGLFHRAPAGLPSFGTAALDLSSNSANTSAASAPQRSMSSAYTPPAASRHALFSHHAAPPLIQSSSFMSDPGPSGPPSPSFSASSGTFSPASAFLSHFQSSTSLQSSVTLAPDAPGAKVLSYTLGKILGRGGFSTVREAIHEVTGEIFACKIVKRDDLSDRSGSLERFEEEIVLWQSMPRHPSILPLIEMHRTPYATFMITPHMSGGSLLDVLKREGGSEKTARKWFPGIVAAVSALHEGYEGCEGRILHGDLKLDNFLCDKNGHVVVGDFGMARKVAPPHRGRSQTPIATIPPPLTSAGRASRSRSRSRMGRDVDPSARRHPPLHSHHLARPGPKPPGSPVVFPSASLPYAPPELLRAPPAEPTLAQDMWALGIILHALLTGLLPFVDVFEPRLQAKILRNDWVVPPGLGMEWEEVLKGCLHGDVSRRWTIANVRNSDAISGWREVKPRSKSRSRSRQRLAVGVPPQTLMQQRGSSRPRAEPVVIASPRRHRGISISSMETTTGPNRLGNMTIDPFAEVTHNSSASSTSHSDSRSRSSGRGGHITVFDFENGTRRKDPSPEQLPPSLDSSPNRVGNVGRGRSLFQHRNEGISTPSGLSLSAVSSPNASAPSSARNSRSRSRGGKRNTEVDGSENAGGDHKGRWHSLEVTPQAGSYRGRSRSRGAEFGRGRGPMPDLDEAEEERGRDRAGRRLR